MTANHLVTYTDGSSTLFEDSVIYKVLPGIWTIIQGFKTTMIFTDSVRAVRRVNVTRDSY